MYTKCLDNLGSIYCFDDINLKFFVLFIFASFFNEKANET